MDDNSKAIAAQSLAHLDALDGNVHFKWFMETIVGKLRDEERAKALNVSSDEASCAHARFCHALAEKILNAPVDRRKLWEKTLRSA